MKRMEKVYSFSAILFLLCAFCCSATEVSYDSRGIIIDGDHKILFSGSIHYPRSTPEMWPDLVRRAKDGGLDAIETYVFWDAHEPQRRQYNFEGRNDLVRFIKTIQEAGLYAVLRIGPYVCAEWNYGGLPTWLHTLPGVQLRTDNPIFKHEMANFTTLIVDMMKQERLLAPQGGPIIIAQIENEYGNVAGPYGEAGKRYIKWCAKLAESYKIGIPWVMCQQADAPVPMINTCNGWYCDNFTPTNPNTPKMWTENWTGWFKAWGEDNNNPHRRVEDIAFAVARFYQTGGTFQNYYMYHGGTNFGRVTGGPYITTTYDYDAPLDEYGYPREPKYSHLKKLHITIKSMEKVLTKGDNSTKKYEDGVSVTIYNYNGTKGCFLSNTNETKDATINFEGKKYFVPAWSVSILPNCKEEVYNTAKVTSQTSLIVRKPGLDQSFTWTWREENIDDELKAKGTFSAPRLQEQLATTVDKSDYLWYMTSFQINGSDTVSKTMKLRVNTTGHGLHAFFNGALVGSHYGEKKKLPFVLEAPINIKDGINHIALLSVTVGLANYGAKFDLAPTGIIKGPVELVDGNPTINLSSHRWTYKTGLKSLQEGLPTTKDQSSYKWNTQNLPIDKMLTWYKTTFSAPLGLDPVVVDLQGLGKGEAWVNGQSIGRFWPKSTSPITGCPEPCDYRGKYSPSKCSTDCGQASQRWYHIPRSFLKADGNTLILFEELGGNPTGISFHTVSTGTVCASVPEGKILELSCSEGHTISEIEVATYGDGGGVCGSFGTGTCHSKSALSAVQETCVGKPNCSLEVSDAVLGVSDCDASITKNLRVQAHCY